MMDFNSKKLAFLNTVKDFYSRCMLYLFSERKNATSSTKRCILYIDDHTLYFLYAEHTASHLKIAALEKYSFKDNNALTALVGTLSRQFSLQTTPVSWLMNESDYQLLFLEALPVPEEEVRQALTWRLKSTLQKMGETLVDYFYLPAKPGAVSQSMITAVAVTKKSLNEILEISKKYQVNLDVIDIPELALRNLTAQGENDDKSTALLYIDKQHITFSITKGKMLYLTRKISWVYSQDKDNLSEVSLEIVRYFDYFQSYWRLPAPTRVYLIADESNQTTIINKLSGLLSMTILPFSMEHEVITPSRVSGRSWLLLGELFRDTVYGSTKH